MTVVALLMLMGSVAYSQTTQVVSRNAVGYVKKTMQKGQIHLLNFDFLTVDGSAATASEVFGDQLPTGTRIFIWDPSAQDYSSATEVKGFAGWLPNTNDFSQAYGFWLQVPSGVASNEYQVFMMGEVPDRFTRPTGTVAVAGAPGGALTLIGYPYPVSQPWTNLAIAQNAVNGDRAFFYDTDLMDYVTLVRGFAGWVPNDFVVEPGSAFWYRTTTAQVWEEPKPYVWP
jgi:hypothetical protein